MHVGGSMQESMSSHIPSEIIDLILLNLPQKSLVRFSTVSKSWNSMISDPQFIRRHKSRAILLRREKILFSLFVSPSSSDCSLSLSSLSSPQMIDDSEPVFFPFKKEEIPKLGEIEIIALCDGICLVSHHGSLFLWNHSNRTYRKLPRASYEPDPPAFCWRLEFGLGFDSSSDDYKVLKINNFSDSQFDELYSLRSDSWKKVQSFPPRYRLFERGGSVREAGGAFHTIVYKVHHLYVIVSFDLSTEKYGEVAPPPCSPELGPRSRATLTVLREKLCVYVNYETSKFVLWVMQEYGIEKSWVKMFEIDYKKICRYTQWRYEEHNQCIYVSPLNFYDDNGEIFITVSKGVDPPIIMHIDKGSIHQTVFSGCSSDDWICEYSFVETLTCLQK